MGAGQSWECQGRQEHGYFGSGTCGDTGESAASDVVHGAIGHLNAAQRVPWAKLLDGGVGAASVKLLAAWAGAGALDRAAFRARFLTPETSDATTDLLRDAVRAMAGARTPEAQRAASGAFAAAVQAVGVEKWARFVTAASERLAAAPVQQEKAAPVAAHDPEHRNPANVDRFYDIFDGPLSKLAADLKLPKEYIFGISSFESGWYDDHNTGLNNPFGLTHAGKMNLRFQSIDDAIEYWKRQYGPQVAGAISAADFAARLEGMLNGVRIQGWNKYNEANENWENLLKKQIAYVIKTYPAWQNK